MQTKTVSKIDTVLLSLNFWITIPIPYYLLLKLKLSSISWGYALANIDCHTGIFLFIYQSDFFYIYHRLGSCLSLSYGFFEFFISYITLILVLYYCSIALWIEDKATNCSGFNCVLLLVAFIIACCVSSSSVEINLIGIYISLDVFKLSKNSKITLLVWQPLTIW